jgi:maltose O-acetyltransferase
MRKLWLLIYYGFAWHLPSRPTPGWKFAYALRRFLVKRIFRSCGEGVIVKRHAYFGEGSTLQVGNRAALGINARIDHDVTIGDDVMIGPDCVIMTISHAFEDPSVPINQQGAAKRMPVWIGRDVFIGTRVIILPGVKIGEVLSSEQAAL